MDISHKFGSYVLSAIGQKKGCLIDIAQQAQSGIANIYTSNTTVPIWQDR